MIHASTTITIAAALIGVGSIALLGHWLSPSKLLAFIKQSSVFCIRFRFCKFIWFWFKRGYANWLRFIANRLDSRIKIVSLLAEPFGYFFFVFHKSIKWPNDQNSATAKQSPESTRSDNSRSLE